MTITKVCRDCKQEKPLEELTKHKQSSHGVDALCKVCNAARSRRWYQNNREQALETRTAYYETHKDEIRAYKRRWQRENREHYYQRHAIWRSGNREKLKKARKAFRDANPEKERDYRRRWLAANLDKKRIATRNRRARKKAAPGQHTLDDILKQYEIQNGMCYWCSQPLNGVYHVDHVIPTTRGGSNWPDNLVCACEFCNLSKGDKIVYEEWEPPNPLFPR